MQTWQWCRPLTRSLYTLPPAITQAGIDRWNQACSKSEEGEQMLELLVKKDAPCLSLVSRPCCCSVFRSPSMFFYSNCSRVFMYGGLSILEQTAQNSKTPKGHSTVGCKQALLQARGRAGRVFRTCGIGVGRAFVARCVCVWSTARRLKRITFRFRK